MMEFQEFSILSWNIRGALNKRAECQVCELIKKHRSVLFFVFEMHICFAKFSRFWQGLGFSPVCIQEAVGRSGGIRVLASQSTFSFSVMDSFHQSVNIKISSASRS